MRIFSVRPAPAGMRNTLGFVSFALNEDVAAFGVKICMRDGEPRAYADGGGRRVVAFSPKIAAQIAKLAFDYEVADDRA